MSSDSIHRLSCGCQVILGPSHHVQTRHERKYLLGQVDSKHTRLFKCYFWIGFKSVLLSLNGLLLVYFCSILFFFLISMTNDIENIPNNRLIFKLNDYPKFEIRWFTVSALLWPINCRKLWFENDDQLWIQIVLPFFLNTPMRCWQTNKWVEWIMSKRFVPI